MPVCVCVCVCVYVCVCVCVRARARVCAWLRIIRVRVYVRMNYSLFSALWYKCICRAYTNAIVTCTTNLSTCHADQCTCVDV